MFTSLDRINVRRMMFYIEKQIRQLTREKQFQCNSPLSLQEQCGKEVLQDIKNRKGIFDFEIERIEPTKSKVTIFFLEGLEPVFIEWNLVSPEDSNNF